MSTPESPQETALVSKEKPQQPAEAAVEITPPQPTAGRRRSKAFRGTVFAARGLIQFALMIAILVGASFLMGQLVESRKERPKRVQKEAVYTVETTIATPARNQPTISVFGDVVAGRSVTMNSLVTGEVVKMNSKVQVGGLIKKGEQILKISPITFENALAEAKANRKEAEAALTEAKARLTSNKVAARRAKEQFELARDDLTRARQLLTRGAITKRQVDERTVTLSQRQASFENAEAQIGVQQAQVEAREATLDRLNVLVKRAETSLADTKLKAPFDAIVQEVTAEVGQMAMPSTPIVTLYEADTLDARFVLSDGQYGRLLKDGGTVIGREINVDWKVGNVTRSFDAVVERIGAEITANRGGITLFARLASESSRTIRPGAFITVQLPDRNLTESFRVPETALFEGNTVYVVNGENRLEARRVTVAVFDGDDVIVGDGLKPGDEIIVTQLAEVGEGVLIRRDKKPASRAPKTARPNETAATLQPVKDTPQKRTN